jgi:hypothetical protein
MRAVKLEGRVQSDHTLRVRLPEDVEEGPAEIIVLLPETQGPRPPLSAVIDSLAGGPRPHRQKGEIDRSLDEERESWHR